MTKPRTSTTREILGILGKLPDASRIQREWNAYFAEQGIDAFMAKYPTTAEILPERLSEMFHFDRRLYLLGPELREEIVPLLDRIEAEPIDAVFNESGVLVGVHIDSEKRSCADILAAEKIILLRQ